MEDRPLLDLRCSPRGLGHPLFPEVRKNDIHSVKLIRQPPDEIRGRKEHLFPKDCLGCFPGEGVQGEGKGGRWAVAALPASLYLALGKGATTSACLHLQALPHA